MAKPLNPLIPLHPSIPTIQQPHLQPQQWQHRAPAEETLTINGPTRLSGHVRISGSKNSSLAILAATLCCSGASKLRNLPDLADIRAMTSILTSLGAEIEVFSDGAVVSTDNVCSMEPREDRTREIRGGFFVIGPLLARYGEATVALPGGCDIGSRPVDLHIRGLRALGAVVESRDGKVRARVAKGRGLVGGSFRLDYPSVGATETLMMAACLADGVTVLSNVAKEPEVTDLAQFLNNSGACVEGVGSDRLLIRGRNRLHGSECIISPDRIEVGTFMIAAAITRSCITMSPVIPSSVAALMHKLRAAGCRITSCSHNSLEVSAVPANNVMDLQGFNVRTSPFPGFPTDLQPQTMALLTTCAGSSTVEESVFERRMGHVAELQKLGARIKVDGSTAFINGKGRGSALCGSKLVASDLRGGASLVLAGLAAEGRTEISAASHIYRGYEDFDKKLALLGADVKRSTTVSTYHNNDTDYL